MSKIIALAVLFSAVASANPGDGRLLAQHPTVNKTNIVFAFAGNLWSVPRDGGEAIRLTAGTGNQSSPYFSPDGTKIAFSGEYDGNVDVFVVPATGGTPKRLTYHPGADIVAGWTPDGKNILFRTNRDSYSRYTRLYTVPAEGGFATPIDLPMADSGSYSADGSHLAYLPLNKAFDSWKRYRGGRTTPIWIANMADAKVEKIPRDNSNDFNPMWIGDKIYFLSDRNGPVTLFSYDMRSKKVAQAIRNDGLDIKAADAGPGAIVYEQFGEVHLYDLKSGSARKVDIRLEGDIPAMRPTFERVNGRFAHAKLSPTGMRALFEARGEILTAPAEKGDIRNLTNTPGVAERDPSWSPDGKSIAYFSDESGEYVLHIRAQNGMGEVEKIDLGKPAAFYYEPRWSPDNKKIAYTDNRLQLWYVDLEKKTPVRIDADTYDTPEHSMNPDWAPDNKWIAYTKLLKNHLRAVFLYSLEEGKSHQISDGMSDAENALFDKNGKYLYFNASTNLGLSTAWLDMSSEDHTTTRSVYAVVLNKTDASPVAPESDDEKAVEEKKPDAAAKKDEAVNVKIDLENIDQRIVALPIPARNYGGMDIGKTGILFVREEVETPGQPPTSTEYKFDLKTRKTEKLVEGIRMFEISGNGEKMMYSQGNGPSPSIFIAATSAPPKPGEGKLNLDAMEVRVDPIAEWKQMYREVWRIERDFFYDPGLHGLNLETFSKRYEPYLENIASRADLNYLFQEMLGELTVGHLFVAGGAIPETRHIRGGLLGADYKIENGRYRFARIYSGENWNPQLKAPLTQPGVNVATGEYLLAMNGRDLRSSDNVYGFFEETAGKQVVLRVGPNADGSGSREVTVIPVDSEYSLRNLAWIEENRRKVDRLSNGKLAYVYLPDTAGGGFTNFNRYFFAQIDREGAVIDERFNGGGQVADYIVDHLNRSELSRWTTRYGEDFTTPQNAIFGPKVMIINEYAGSGGDALPWMFRARHVGTLVGKRTWGGLVGIFGFPELMDGGGVTAPNLAFWNPAKADWEIENHGVPPDIEVEQEPALVRAGHDPQLERAVEVALAELKKHPLTTPKHPPFPNYHKTTPSATTDGGGSK
ncbi:MAG TPA: PDZ domain-containing protein [Bryobacteraceae bacterium]|nr:PDZ domain-containing protein [Bryobacteraceae bacterium]